MTIRSFFRAIFNPAKTVDVFTPTSVARLTYIKREDIEANFNRNFKLTGRNIIVFGLSGSGKTTFLNSYFEANKIKYLVIQCDSDMQFEEMIAQIFDKLNSYYKSSTSQKTEIKNSSNFSLKVGQHKAGLQIESSDSSTDNYNRIISPQLSIDRLADMLGKSGYTLVIEDFHKMQEYERRRLADMIKIFMDKSNEYKKLKIICVGAANTARDILKLDNNLRNRVYECEIPLLRDKEIEEIVKKGCILLNIQMENTLIEKIVHYSNRLGTIAHELSYDVCCYCNIIKTQCHLINIPDNSFTFAVESYIDSRSDTIQEIYDRAIQDSLGWYILRTLSLQPHSKLPFRTICKRVNTLSHSFSDNQVALKLAELSTPEIGILRNHYNGSKYSISDPFWGAFIKLRIATEKKDNAKAFADQHNVNLLLQNQNDIESLLLKILLERNNKRKKT